MSAVTIIIHEGEGLHRGLFRNRDFYVMGWLGAHNFHTSCADNAKSPRWEQSFTLPYNDEAFLTLCVMDKDKMSRDDNMGEGRIEISHLRGQRRITTLCPITYGSESRGSVRVTLILNDPKVPTATGPQPPAVYAAPPIYVAPQTYSPPPAYGYPAQPAYPVQPAPGYGYPPAGGFPQPYGAPPPAYGSPAYGYPHHH